MRIGEILINNTGTLMNPAQQLIAASPITGDASSTSFFCQITLEFFNAISQQPNGLYVPVTSSVVTSGLSGTLAINVYSSQYSPYPAVITPTNVINIANNNILQWSGTVANITFTASSIIGCNYIRVLFDRFGA